MEFLDRAMMIAFLALPPFLFFTVRNRLRAFIYATLALWMLMIVEAGNNIWPTRRATTA